MEQITKRKVALPNFYRKGEDIYEDQLGWPEWAKEDACSSVSKVIFDCEVVRIGFNMAFYYVDNDTFYGIHREAYPVEIKILPRDRNACKFIGYQCEANTHEGDDIIATFENPSDIWDNFKIDGKSLEEVIERSYIMLLT